jgi:hypothetical protein
MNTYFYFPEPPLALASMFFHFEPDNDLYTYLGETENEMEGVRECKRGSEREKEN